MKTKQAENNAILAICREHKFILEDLAELEKCADIPEPAIRVAELKKNIEKFEMNLTRHNRVEEIIIFRNALIAMPTSDVIDTVMNLQKEHGIVETLIGTVNSEIWHVNQNDSKVISRVFLIVREIIRIIKLHTATEVKDLFPKLSKNPSFMGMIGKSK